MNIHFYAAVLPKLAIVKSIYYSLRFKGVFLVGRGCNINIHRNARLIFNDKSSSLYVGVHFSGTSGSTLDIYEGGELRVGKSVGIHRGTKVVVREQAKLSIGNRTFINENSRVVCRKKISIGEGCSIAWCVTISDTDSHGIYTDGVLSNPDTPIEIGNVVWICAHSVITKGSVINDNCILGANTAVLGSTLESGYVYAGNPAKKIKEFESWGAL
jgi:acetyltransferase-like isoleucine patch superfamily enzyme